MKTRTAEEYLANNPWILQSKLKWDTSEAILQVLAKTIVEIARNDGVELTTETLPVIRKYLDRLNGIDSSVPTGIVQDKPDYEHISDYPTQYGAFTGTIGY